MRCLAVAVVALALVARLAAAQNLQLPQVDSQEIGVDAEKISYDKKTNTIVAHGNVVITRGDTELRADEVRLDRTTNEADAAGNVAITTPDGTIVADRVHFDLDEETGLVEEGEVQSTRYGYSLWGKRVEKGLGQSYHIENGRFTTCQCGGGPPSWSISGEDLRINLGGYGTLRGGTFNVLDVPIAYLPRALFPVQRDRQSGFLMPRFGASNTRGFQTLLPFYWAIDKSQDATLAMDLETSARAGAVGEYRYKLSHDAEGQLNGSYFNESFRATVAGPPGEVTIPKERWSFGADHRQVLPDGTQAFADVFMVGDDLFLREINTYAFDHSRTVAIRTLPFTDSTVGLVHLWDRVGVKAQGVYNQDLTGLDAKTLQRAPEISLWGQSLLAGPLLGQLNADAVDFQRGHSVDGARADIEPGVVLPLPLGRMAFGALHASVRETAYHLIDTTLDQSGTVRELPQNQTRELFQIDGQVGTALDRVYQVHWLGLEKIKHTLEPGIEYLYIPAVGQGNLPFFDATDRVNRRNLLTYGLVSRFIGKFASDPGDDEGSETEGGSSGSDGTIRELARFSLAQSVDMNREIDPLQAGRPADHFSDVDFGGRINPSRALSVRFNTNYDTTTNNISATRVGFFVEDPRPSERDQRLETRTSAAVSYRFLNGNLLQEIDDSIVLRLTDWAGFLYSSRYDVVADRFLDNHFGLRLVSTCDCWALDLAVTDRTNPQEVQVTAQLTLVGLGASKSQRRAAPMP